MICTFTEGRKGGRAGWTEGRKRQEMPQNQWRSAAGYRPLMAYTRLIPAVPSPHALDLARS